MTLVRALAAVAAALAAAAIAAASPARADGLSPAELLDRHQPVTVLDAFERFAPTSVEPFLAHSDLLRLGEDQLLHPTEPGPAGLPVHGDGWRLDVRGCSPLAGLAAVPCYDALDTGPSVVYGRHLVRGGTIVLQYWLFYELNFWSLQYPASDLVWQAHEGDWEVVTVVLDERQQPVEAAYSQHCTGQRRPWAAVQKLGDHPVVYVANGSHANLFAPGARPIARQCIPPQALALLDAQGLVAFDVANPVGGRVLGPGTTSVEWVHENTPRWLRFPGTWGGTQYLHAPPPIGTVPFGAGPLTPPLQDDWIDPLETIAGYPAG